MRRQPRPDLAQYARRDDANFRHPVVRQRNEGFRTSGSCGPRTLKAAQTGPGVIAQGALDKVPARRRRRSPTQQPKSWRSAPLESGSAEVINGRSTSFGSGLIVESFPAAAARTPGSVSWSLATRAAAASLAWGWPAVTTCRALTAARRTSGSLSCRASVKSGKTRAVSLPASRASSVTALLRCRPSLCVATRPAEQPDRLIGQTHRYVRIDEQTGEHNEQIPRIRPDSRSGEFQGHGLLHIGKQTDGAKHNVPAQAKS